MQLVNYLFLKIFVAQIRWCRGLVRLRQWYIFSIRSSLCAYGIP